jgi:hypothetical protein
MHAGAYFSTTHLCLELYAEPIDYYSYNDDDDDIIKTNIIKINNYIICMQIQIKTLTPKEVLWTNPLFSMTYMMQIVNATSTRYAKNQLIWCRYCSEISKTEANFHKIS